MGMTEFGGLFKRFTFAWRFTLDKKNPPRHMALGDRELARFSFFSLMD
jgi:hypothetical protein